MTKPISSRDREVLSYIVSFTNEFGYPPTVREIGEALYMTSPSTVQNHLVALTDAGYILRTKMHSPRAIQVLATPEDWGEDTTI